MPLGNMTINSISRLNRLGPSTAYALPTAPTIGDLEDSDEEEGMVSMDLGNVIPLPSASRPCVYVWIPMYVNLQLSR